MLSPLFFRYPLAILLALVALNAFGGGLYGMAGAKGIPLSWLQGTPFQNYFFPSLILFALVGGSSLCASIAVFRQSRLGRLYSFSAGAILLIWMAVQLALIGEVSWLQPAMVVIGVTIIVLTARLRASA